MRSGICEHMNAQARSIGGGGGPDYTQIRYFAIATPHPHGLDFEELGKRGGCFCFFTCQDFAVSPGSV